ncbi:sensor histidine kinase [Parvularcula marina]|uniref:Sensor histidine kinase n=1 Tax=Parvularcula marina TaxID=2292771 RepID=A0A371RHK5_9PROT|nr:histidine kinase [Parvularcula marina]RFB04936.1 sensor histidine kinase [Parvularcula marina]
MLNKTEQTGLSSSRISTQQFWVFHIGGWSAMALVSYLSLTIWYNPGQLIPALHTVLQSVLGLFVSYPLRWAGSALWNAPIIRRVILNGAAIILASIIWTALRVTTFTALTGEVINPADWGGWLYASLTIFGAWSFCYHALKYYRQWLEQRQLATEAQKAALEAQTLAQLESLKRLEAESQYKDAKLRMLKYQLNPHFLFNALNSVTHLVRKGDQTSATEMLVKIAEFLRTSLEHDDELLHSLRDELEVIELYLAIEKSRFGDRLQTEFNVSDEALNVNVPSFLLQPVYENAMKYAVGQSLSPTVISFSAECDGDDLTLSISDTGPGFHEMEESSARSSIGIGLRNVEERLQSQYGANYNLRIENNDKGGASVRITIPAKLESVKPVPVDEDVLG